MAEKKDFYWTITKNEFTGRLKVLTTPYHQVVWNYLQAYIIRGSAETTLWNVCYSLYRVNGLLASHIGIGRMSKDLNISRPKIISILCELDKDNHIIKYTSKNGNTNNTNIYILGFKNTNTLEGGNITVMEKLFVNKIKEMTPEIREKIVKLYIDQIETSETIKKMSEELTDIQKILFDEE